jgi:hypothetical protein
LAIRSLIGIFEFGTENEKGTGSCTLHQSRESGNHQFLPFRGACGGANPGEQCTLGNEKQDSVIHLNAQISLTGTRTHTCKQGIFFFKIFRFEVDSIESYGGMNSARHFSFLSTVFIKEHSPCWAIIVKNKRIAKRSECEPFSIHGACGVRLLDQHSRGKHAAHASLLCRRFSMRTLAANQMGSAFSQFF